MAKGIALLLATLLLQACSKSNSDQPVGAQIPTVESFPIANTQFKNCTFKEQTPTYSANAAITPNYISCDEGVAKAVQLLSGAKLPAGLRFDLGTLSLVGTPTEKVTAAPFDFYIENEAGYLILHMAITVK